MLVGRGTAGSRFRLRRAAAVIGALIPCTNGARPDRHREPARAAPLCAVKRGRAAVTLTGGPPRAGPDMPRPRPRHLSARTGEAIGVHSRLNYRLYTGQARTLNSRPGPPEKAAEPPVESSCHT